MPALVVPGVRVEARFDVLPPQPAPSGILGVVGVVDRPTADGAPLSVSKVTELRDLLGPGTGVSMPQVVAALANGASEAVVAPVLGGAAASVKLKNLDGNDVLVLRCRSNGAWANDHLVVESRVTTDGNGKPLRVALQLLRDGTLVESWPDLRVAPGAPDDLFDVINAGSSHVVAIDPATADATPAPVDATFDPTATPVAIDVVDATDAAKKLLRLLPADGANPAGLRVTLAVATGNKLTVEVFQNGLQERFTDLVINPDNERHLPYVLQTQSRLVRARAVSALSADKSLPAASATPAPFAGGQSPKVEAYRTAINQLAEDSRIDLVLAAIEPTVSDDDVRQIHQALMAHAVTLSDAGAPRIAFGSVTAAEQHDFAKTRDHAALVRNRRFVLVSPAGAEGAVAGMIGRMNPQDSPTFKTTPLHGLAAASYRESELNRLLGSTVNLLVVQERRGRGVVVLKGIDTTGDEISVTRVADQAIRETKAIAENFIGELNTDAARIALKQQIVGTLTRMERASALVPSTDGQDPAFVVDVYSTQLDFAQGIVRIDIAVRPVRAIHYVYATLRVKI